ncbi:hypothetical protein [Phocaeicola dorei]|uniref:Uncharacterized protein n=1 Tax=Phocaeicola dorei CL03T12C01 TaxID=997877 RepID=I9G6J0_9BACT|nr:hypothetical protein [Phocaeicola dorei]AND20743.1 hypothetical protein ABI39_15995 [Phocaeicola dorei CL03T12C01]EIY42009.1 hypothetical protein HMPREF1065_00375 [Phocaeicola dorei CL03T12C01]
MELIDIKDISGKILLTILPEEGCKRKFTLMKEDYIMLKFSLENPVFFKLGSSVECDFGLFEVCDLQKPVFNTNTAGYDYELRLDAYYWKWKNKIFKYTPETAGQEASWNLTAPLDVQAGIVLRNLKALGYTYKGQDFVFSIDSTVENKSQLMSYENINILDACFSMAKKWDCECRITENIIHFGRCEFGDAVDFEIGKNVQEMPRSESRSTYATRIYAFGSTKNIPSNYRPVDETVVVNGVVQRRLMLPEGTPYIDAYPDMTTEEAIEQVVIFDEVYPRRTGTMSDVTTIEVTDKVENEDGTTTEEKWNAYRFRDTGVNFSEKYILPGQELRIRFASGLLNGLEFAVKFNPEGKPEKLEDGGWNPEAQLWEIVRNSNYGPSLPDDVQYPQDGDEYVLSGWDSTKITELGLVGAAEQELKVKTEKYASKSKVDPSTYDCTMMSGDAYREDGIHNLYSIGQKVNLINKAYFDNGRQSRIIGFEFNLDFPFDSPVYTVGETAAYSRIGELEEKVESLTLKGQTYTGGGGSGVYVIGSHDSTPATDHNVYSALRSLIMFMRKDTEERTSFLLSLLGGTVIKKYAKFGDFVTGISGGYIGEDARAELEALVLRSSLSVPELRFNRQTYFEGYNTISPGGGLKIKSFVANSDGSYTVTPDLEDGVPLGQKPDDILLGFWHDKSVTTGDFIGFRKIQYRITSADYDEKTFVMVPRPGYEFVPHNEMRLGQTGNFTDKERQTYIIIDVRDGNCCITLVDDANTWDPEPAQMKSWFGKKKGMTINGINCDRFSAVLQDIIMTGLIFQVDEITGQTVRVPLDKGEWVAGKYAYYDRVSHNGALWLCVDDNGTTTEPSDGNTAWLKQVAKGDKGDPGLSVVGGGHWESANTPYSANTMVTLANCVFLSKVETSNPPIRILRVKGGNFLRKKDGGYYLAGKPADWEVNEDWDMLLDGRELKGESITFLGEFASHPSNPKEGDSYRNTADYCTYIYQHGLWMVMVKDGTDGKDGKGYEWIYTRTNIIGLTPDKPDSKQQDDYVPEGWTDDFLGVDSDHQVEWACKRVKRDGVWSEFSDPAPVHRWSKDGENAIMADFDNEMVNAALTSDGKVVSSQTWNTTVSMWYGTEKLTLDSITCTPDTNLLCATDKNTGVVTISVSAGATLAATNTVKITIRATKNGQQYSRDLTFTVAGVRGGANGADAILYSIVVSASSVSKDKNGNYSVSSVSCYRQMSVGGVISTTTDGILKYSIDGGAETTINNNTAISSGNFTKTLKFVFYVNDQIVDVETVPMLVDGKDGADGESITAAGHWESANIPYAKNSTVSFAEGSYLSKVQTSNPPLPLLRVRGGSYLRKKDGGYILSGKRSDKAVNSDWQEMTSGVEPSASYWLDSPVSTINFTSTGTPSPSAFVVTMKQNIGGNVSDTNRFYLVARKYNGSWLAHVGATLSNQISVPATAGYTQFAVRAYKSASDANAWNNNFVAEKGVGVAKDGDIGATGATGAFPRDRGVWASGQTYVWNADYRDKVIYLIGGVYYNFLVKNYGASVTSAPTSANGDSNWEAMQKFVNIATDTLFADGANVAGFMFKNNVLKSHNDEGETLLINGVTGYFKCKNAEITGTITSTKGNIGGFTISSASLEAVSGNNAMLLSANLVRFTGSYSSVFIGADTFPSSSGGAILCPSRISVNRNITNTAYGNVGMYFDIQGSHAYDDNDFQYTGNHALYIVKGDICGFRLRLRRISKSTTLSVMDSVIMAVTSGITLTVPSTAEDGQFYWIRNVSGGDVTIAGTNLVGWNSGEVSTSIGLAKSKAAAMYYDKHNNKWFMNWIDCWN